MEKELIFRQKNLIPKELAIEIIKLGFNEAVIGGYYKDGTFAYHPDSDIVIDCPLYQQAFRWFREKYSYHHSIYYHKSLKFECRVADVSDNNLSDDLFGNMYLTYEEAELECLKKLIEIIKAKS